IYRSLFLSSLTSSDSWVASGSKFCGRGFGSFRNPLSIDSESFLVFNLNFVLHATQPETLVSCPLKPLPSYPSLSVLPPRPPVAGLQASGIHKVL
ncbi:hypothetical protein Tsubulata_003084, partial [Turnera subulata]